MRRGDFVTVAMQGDFGKPRPALVIQADLFCDQETVTVLPVTGTLTDAPLFRVSVDPDDQTGLKQRSQVMVDKALTIRRGKIGLPFGRIGAETMVEVERCLALYLGIAK